MALGFTSHCNHNNQHAAFGALTASHNVDSNSENSSTGLITGYNSDYINQSIGYDSCEFSTSVVVDYAQYANVFVASSSSETAGSVASVGGCDCSSAGSSAGGCASFGGCGGGMSCASFTC